MGKIQRDRGASTEREVAKLMTAALGTLAKRRLGQAREGGHDIDIDLPLVTEVKRRKGPLAVMKWLQQADASSKEGMSLAVARSDGGRFVAVMYFDDWLEVYAGYLKWREQLEALL